MLLNLNILRRFRKLILSFYKALENISVNNFKFMKQFTFKIEFLILDLCFRILFVYMSLYTTTFIKMMALGK